jgi:hypothetical protein
MSSRGTVIPKFTIGFGNNLFQYCYSRLLAEKNNLDLWISHGDGSLTGFGIQPNICDINPSLPTVFINDTNYKKSLFMDDLQDRNVGVNGYFEDYKIFKPFLSEIRSWFPQQKITNTKDVVLHLRLQNRLIQVSHNKNHIKVDSFKRVLKEFEYENLHIVTDAEKWEPYSSEDIEKIRHEISIGPNPPSNSPWVDIEQSKKYINHLIEEFRDLNPIVHCNGAKTIKGSGGLRDDYMKDFNLIRSFNQVIIFNSTFSWWAALLSGAEKVAVFDPWKIAKPKRQRRNLGKTNYPGWFNWGSVEDLYFKEYNIK